MAAILRALGLFARGRRDDDVPATGRGDAGPGGATAGATAAEVVTATATTAMAAAGFDMHAEIAILAERIIEPVAARLTAQQLKEVVAGVRDAFERFDAGAAPAPDFGALASGIVTPVRANLTEAEYRRAVDRLSGALAAFCQGLGQRAA